jgi:hypothetical protein
MQLRRAVLLAAGVLVLSLGVASTSDGQGYRQRGITPIFDGWETLADGSRLIYFGYINRSRSGDSDRPVEHLRRVEFRSRPANQLPAWPP